MYAWSVELIIANAFQSVFIEQNLNRFKYAEELIMVAQNRFHQSIPLGSSIAVNE